jgi:MFS transporter, UMF1 family
MGYLGGVILLLFNLLMIMKPALFGISANSSLPARISFVTVFLWWIGFSQITFYRLPKYTFRKRKGSDNLLTNGYKELRTVFFQVIKSFRITLFLGGFFFIMMGLLTVMFMAATYGVKEIGIKEGVIILTVLIIQLVGMFGAWSFSRLSGKIGNLKALMTSVLVWICVCSGIYFVKNVAGFITVAMIVGMVMGGTQSLARSTYAKMLPETTDHTSFFSFYDVLEKMATVGGTFSFGIIEAITGSMRFSVLAITLFFLLGFLCFLIILIKEKSDIPVETGNSNTAY